jgi:hypothetical protein
MRNLATGISYAAPRWRTVRLYGSAAPVVVAVWAVYLYALVSSLIAGDGTETRKRLRSIRQYTTKLVMAVADLRLTGTDGSAPGNG